MEMFSAGARDRNPETNSSRQPLRILMTTCHPGIQGPFPKILPPLASALGEMGCHVSTEPWGRHRDTENRFEKVVGRLKDLSRLRRTLKACRFDLLLLHTAHEWPNFARDIPLLWLSRSRVRRIVIQMHGSYPDQLVGPGRAAFKRASKALLQRSDAMLLLSSEEKRQWETFYPQGQFFLVNNAFTPATARPPLSRHDSWFRPPAVPVILYVGRLIREKGIFDLLAAMVQLRRHTPCHLVMVGAGPEEAEVKATLKRSGLADHVTLAGYLSGEELVQAYHDAAVFVLPSWAEGMPVVLTEAMAAGKPIVTTRLRGAVDHLQEGEHVCFVAPKNPADLANGLAKVLSDPALQKRMSNANRTKVRDFAPDRVAEAYLDVLNQIAG